MTTRVFFPCLFYSSNNSSDDNHSRNTVTNINTSSISNSSNSMADASYHRHDPYRYSHHNNSSSNSYNHQPYNHGTHHQTIAMPAPAQYPSPPPSRLNHRTAVLCCPSRRWPTRCWTSERSAGRVDEHFLLLVSKTFFLFLMFQKKKTFVLLESDATLLSSGLVFFSAKRPRTVRSWPENTLKTCAGYRHAVTSENLDPKEPYTPT